MRARRSCGTTTSPPAPTAQATATGAPLGAISRKVRSGPVTCNTRSPEAARWTPVASGTWFDRGRAAATGTVSMTWPAPIRRAGKARGRARPGIGDVDRASLGQSRRPRLRRRVDTRAGREAAQGRSSRRPRKRRSILQTHRTALGAKRSRLAGPRHAAHKDIRSGRHQGVHHTQHVSGGMVSHLRAERQHRQGRCAGRGTSKRTETSATRWVTGEPRLSCAARSHTQAAAAQTGVQTPGRGLRARRTRCVCVRRKACSGRDIGSL